MVPDTQRAGASALDFEFSIGHGTRSTAAETFEATDFSDFATSILEAQCLDGGHPPAPRDTAEKEALPWVGPSYTGGKRSGANALPVPVLLLDVDRCTKEAAQRVADFIRGQAPAFGYTTASHTAEAPRFRMALSTSRPITPDEGKRLAALIEAKLFEAHPELSEVVKFDRAQQSAGQIAFLPCEGFTPLRLKNPDAAPLDVDAWLASAPVEAPAPVAALVPERPETPEAVAEARSALASINADCDRDRWLALIFALRSTGWTCAQELAREWSQSAPHRYDEGEFNKAWGDGKERQGGAKRTLATVYRYAKEEGWEGGARCAPLARDDGAVCAFDGWLTLNEHFITYSQNRWLVFDGARLAPDEGKVRELAKTFVADTYRSAAEAKVRDPDSPFVDKRMRASHALLDQRKQDSMLAAARTTLRWQGQALDLRRDELCCPNGVVNLRTGGLIPASPYLGHTRMATVAYNPDAVCSRWEAFLEYAQPDPEMRAYLQRLVGYWLTGELTEEMFSLFVGDGGNGKGTFLDTVAGMMGEYAYGGAGELMLTGKRSPGAASPEVVKAIGSRLVYGNESEEMQRLAEAQVKRLASTGKLIARPLYGEPIEFDGTFKLCMATNFLPQIKDATDSTWRRLQVVTWGQKLVKERGARELKAILRDEWEGVMAWGVRGSVDWYAQGLNPPAAVTRAGEEYRAESDDLAAFIRNHVEEGGFTTTGALLDAYIRAAGIRHPPTVDAFGRELRKRKLVPGRSPDGKRRGFRATLTHGEADDFDGAASDT